jgi:predicted phage terminase large subunit-like protein
MIPFATEAKRHKIARGGRGSGKSWSIARLLVARAVSKRTRWLCCRETQKSTKESSHRLLSDTIAELGVSHLFDIQQTLIKGPHGSEFSFVGLQEHTAESIKSYEGYDGAWCEEANKITERSANILIPTIRMPGSELWWSYNPDQTEDYIHKMAENPASDTLVVTINYMDNPWFPPELEAERLKMLAVNKDLHDHVYGGMCRSIAGLLFKRAWFRRYDAEPANLNKYLSSDWATTPADGTEKTDPDWTEHGIFAMDPAGDTYITDWWSGQTDPDDGLNAWIAMIRRHRPVMAFDEAGVIHRAINATRNRKMREAQAFIRLETLASAGNKWTRAMGFAARAAAGTVFVKQGKWGDKLIDQLCAFNGEDGRTDDMVDACSLFARGLDFVADARAPEKTEKKTLIPLSPAWFEDRDRMRANEDEDRESYYR